MDELFQQLHEEFLFLGIERRQHLLAECVYRGDQLVEQIRAGAGELYDGAPAS